MQHCCYLREENPRRGSLIYAKLLVVVFESGVFVDLSLLYFVYIRTGNPAKMERALLPLCSQGTLNVTTSQLLTLHLGPTLQYCIRLTLRTDWPLKVVSVLIRVELSVSSCWRKLKTTVSSRNKRTCNNNAEDNKPSELLVVKLL